MTRREWMWLNHPETISIKFLGGVESCPCKYEDLPDNEVHPTACDGDCFRCWDKEIKEILE